MSSRPRIERAMAVVALALAAGCEGPRDGEVCDPTRQLVVELNEFEDAERVGYFCEPAPGCTGAAGHWRFYSNLFATGLYRGTPHGDAAFCGCDGETIRTYGDYPRRRWQWAGSCEAPCRAVRPVWGGGLAYHALDVWGENSHFQPVSPDCAACAEVPIPAVCSPCAGTLRFVPDEDSGYVCTGAAGVSLPRDCCDSCELATLSVDGECASGSEQHVGCCDGCGSGSYDDGGFCLSADRSAFLPLSCCDCGEAPVRTAAGACVHGEGGHVLSDACCE